jgi:hypothetical protein
MSCRARSPRRSLRPTCSPRPSWLLCRSLRSGPTTPPASPDRCSTGAAPTASHGSSKAVHSCSPGSRAPNVSARSTGGVDGGRLEHGHVNLPTGVKDPSARPVHHTRAARAVADALPSRSPAVAAGCDRDIRARYSDASAARDRAFCATTRRRCRASIREMRPTTGAASRRCVGAGGTGPARRRCDRAMRRRRPEPARRGHRRDSARRHRRV